MTVYVIEIVSPRVKCQLIGPAQNLGMKITFIWSQFCSTKIVTDFKITNQMIIRIFNVVGN